MAINCYTGLMGGGKTYQVVKEPTLQALKKNRRVVTNINGINPEKIKEYLKKHHPNLTETGEVIYVTDDQVKDPSFFPTDKEEGFVQRGDLVVIDEAWRYWGVGEKLSPRHLEFFTKHRHYTNEKAQTCDIVVIVQEMGLLNKQLKVLCEMTFHTQKKKALGMPKYFQLTIYDGNKLTRANIISTTVQKYNPEIFPLYKSYAGGEGKEVIIDDRTNIFKNKFFIGGLILSVVAIFYSFSSLSALKDKYQKPKDKTPTGQATPLGEAPATKPLPTAATPPAPVQNNSYAIVGVIDSAYRRVVLIKNNKSNTITQIFYDNNCIDKGIFMSCIFDNNKVTVYSSSDTGVNNANNSNGGNVLPIHNNKS